LIPLEDWLMRLLFWTIVMAGCAKLAMCLPLG
jgi:hypothetical protein